MAMSLLERLFEIEKNSANVGGLDANEVNDLLMCIQGDVIEEAAMAIGIMCENQESLIEVICERYYQFPQSSQKLIIASLATVNRVGAQSFVLELLHTETRADYVALIKAALVRSEYDLSPLFFDYLDQDHFKQKEQVIACIKERGFEKLIVYLISRDSVPHEKTLRACFGNKVIDVFQKNKAQFRTQGFYTNLTD